MARGRILIVGEASRTGRAFRGGRSVARLCGLTGLSERELHRRVRFTNLLPYWPGRAAHGGDAWPREDARVRASTFLARAVRCDRLVLAGTRVAAAFGVDAPFLRWAWLRRVEWGPVFGLRTLVRLDRELVPDVRVAVLPHPSGVNRWWNDVDNRNRARRFMRALTQEG